MFPPSASVNCFSVAGVQVERPDVVDVAVLRDLGIDRRCGVGGRRGEDDRVIVDELGRGLIVRAEGDLRLPLRGEIHPEQLLIAADAGVVDDELAVGRVGRPVIEEVVGREVDHLERLQIHRVDVADAAAQRRKRDQPAVGRETGRFGLVHRPHRHPHFDFPRQHVLHDQRTLLLGAHEVGQAIPFGRPRHPVHGHPIDVHRDEVREPQVLVEPFRQVAHDRPVLRRQEHDVVLAILAVAGDRRQSDRRTATAQSPSPRCTAIFSGFGARLRP